MVTIANKYFGELGTLIGNVEVSIYKILKNQDLKRTAVTGARGDVYNIKLGPSKETHQGMAVFVNGTPAMRCNVHELLDALEGLEKEYYG